MFVKSKKISQARMDICRGCKHFVKSTGTCGPLGVGKRVQVKGEKYKLCGCLMKVKTQIGVSACPIGNWGRQMSEREYQEAKLWLEKWGSKRTLPAEARTQLVALSNSVLGKNRGNTKCGPCLDQMVSEMRRAIDVGL